MLGSIGQKIQKIPLRHESHEFRMHRQMREIDHRNRDVADFDFSLPHFLMRQLQEIFQEPQVLHRLERRGMDRVAAKITQKIRMFFENDRIDAGAGKEKPEHHPGRSAADDAAAAGDCLRSLVHRRPSKEAHRSTIGR